MQARYYHATIIALAAISLLGLDSWAQIAPPDPDVSFSINAAGATFPFPLIDLWRVEYGEQYPNVSLNYQSIGSGGGIKQHIEHTVNFAASDVPMTASEELLATGTLHIPESIGGVVIAYNVPEIPQSGMQLDGPTLAMIFLDEITMWDDPRIVEQNPEISLPNEQIISAHRSDGSGTTFILTDYLATVSDDFERIVGAGKSVPWPSGVGSAGNEGVAKIVRDTEYAIGYVELAYAFQTGMTYAYMQNGDRTAYIEPTIESISAASAGIAPDLPTARQSWKDVSIVNAPGPNSYPISSLTYLLVYGDLGPVADSHKEAASVIHLLNWMLTEGQAYSESLLYVPIPESIVQIGVEGLSSITYNEMPIWGVPLEAMAQSDTSGSDGQGGCLIATAAYGTEMAPQIQELREVRDNILMQTSSGVAFMSAFNEVYYSFSPKVADAASQSPETRQAMRALISPMLSSLVIMSYAEGGSDLDVVFLGSLVIALNIGMYIVTPAVTIWGVRRLARRGGSSC